MKSKTYHLNVRASNDWSKDDSKFGQRMLEKMGWKKGQGLGLKHQGISENVKLRVKLNTKGLGFKQKDDELLQIGNSFTDLLNKLKSADNDINGETNAGSPISLERRSEKLKSRLHYHRYTRGKDLSQYDKKSLSEILGFSVSDELDVEENDLKLPSKTMTQLIEDDYNVETADKPVLTASESKIKSVGKKKKRNAKTVLSDTETELPVCDSGTKKSKKHKNTELEAIETAELVHNYEECSKNLILDTNNLCKSNDNLNSCHSPIDGAKTKRKSGKKCKLNDEPDSNVTFTNGVMLEQFQLTNFDQNNSKPKKNRAIDRTKLVDSMDSANDEKPIYHDDNINNKENLADEFDSSSKRLKKKKSAVNIESTSSNADTPIDGVCDDGIIDDETDDKVKETCDENQLIDDKGSHSQFEDDHHIIVSDQKKHRTEKEELNQIRNVRATIDDSGTMRAVNGNSDNIVLDKKTRKRKYKNSDKINDANVSFISDNAEICEQSNEPNETYTVSVSKRKGTTKDDSLCSGKKLKTSDTLLNGEQNDRRSGDPENVADAECDDVESKNVSACNCENSNNESSSSVRIIFDQYERHNVQLMIAQRSQEQYTEMKQHNNDKVADNKIALRLKNFEEKMELLQKIRTNSIQINFNGSNIMDIKGYGVSVNKQR